MRLRAPAVVACFAGLCAIGQPAAATEVTRAHMNDLARRAPADPAALDELRSVTSVDGRRVDMERALAGASGSDLSDRLGAIAEAPDAAAAVQNVDAKKRASDILSQRRYQPGELPRPLRGPIQRFEDALGRLFRRVADLLPGGEATLWVVLAAIFAIVAALLASRLARRRRRDVALGKTAIVSAVEERMDARKLLREADRAEASGDTRTAIRLRFRAGLLRLGEQDAIAYRPSMTTGEVRRTLRLADFDAVATSFEEVFYGDREPAGTDLELSRHGWENILQRVAA